MIGTNFDTKIAKWVAQDFLTVAKWNPAEEELCYDGELAVKSNRTQKISSYSLGQNLAEFIASRLECLVSDLRSSKRSLLEKRASQGGRVGNISSAVTGLEIVMQLWKRCEPNLKVLVQRLETSESEANSITIAVTKLSGGSKKIVAKMEQIRQEGVPESVSFVTRFIDANYSNNLVSETVLTEDKTRHHIFNFYNVKVQDSKISRGSVDGTAPSSCVGRLQFTFTKAEGVVLGEANEVVTEKVDGTSSEQMRIYFNEHSSPLNSLTKDLRKKVIMQIFADAKPSFITYDKRDEAMVKDRKEDRHVHGYWKDTTLQMILSSDK